MSGALTVFHRELEFEGSPVRVVMHAGDPWFVASDVARLLEYANPQKAVRDHCKHAVPLSSWGGVNDSFTPLDPQTTMIPEGDVYRLLSRSNLPSADRFDTWVHDEVLPSIRRTGSYGLAINVRDPAQLNIIATQLLEVQKELQERAERAEQQLVAAQPKVEFYDQFVEADGLYTLQNAGRVLGQGSNLFVRWLKENTSSVRAET
jgi:anti-repressor protein